MVPTRSASPFGNSLVPASGTTGARRRSMRPSLLIVLSLSASANDDSAVDWEQYSALVANDLPAWAAATDPSVRKRVDEVRGKRYQLLKLRAGLQRDPRLRAAFDE